MTLPNSTRHPTPYCRNGCQQWKATKKRSGSIYEENARCHNCETYIPRKMLIGLNGKTKAKCPCCLKTWLKGVYVGMGMKRLSERNKMRRLRLAVTGIRGNLSLAI